MSSIFTRHYNWDDKEAVELGPCPEWIKKWKDDTLELRKKADDMIIKVYMEAIEENEQEV